MANGGTNQRGGSKQQPVPKEGSTRGELRPVSANSQRGIRPARRKVFDERPEAVLPAMEKEEA
jgi:hypothetical protein